MHMAERGVQASSLVYLVGFHSSVNIHTPHQIQHREDGKPTGSVLGQTHLCRAAERRSSEFELIEWRAKAEDRTEQEMRWTKQQQEEALVLPIHSAIPVLSWIGAGASFGLTSWFFCAPTSTPFKGSKHTTHNSSCFFIPPLALGWTTTKHLNLLIVLSYPLQSVPIPDAVARTPVFSRFASSWLSNPLPQPRKHIQVASRYRSQSIY